KPKYHMLCHASYWMQQYGPQVNYHVEEEEAMNSCLRLQLEHSNRQGPSRDLAHRFAVSEGLKFILQGGRWVNPKSKELCQA
ncbi:hypothetical protein L873DRAFT_1614891, partial [Choiromyces venosus 120613-1]